MGANVLAEFEILFQFGAFFLNWGQMGAKRKNATCESVTKIDRGDLKISNLKWSNAYNKAIPSN